MIGDRFFCKTRRHRVEYVDTTHGRALHVATANGHKEVGELLIAKGPDVNGTDVVLGYTPLIRIDVD